MDVSSKIRTGRHCVFNMHVHLVFVTKYRRNVLTPNILLTLKDFFIKICNNMESTLVECDGEDDHVHLLVEYPPKISIAKLVNALKGASSRKIRKQYPALNKFYWKGVFWSPSYFASSCGGAPLNIIKQYIEQQRLSSSP